MGRLTEQEVRNMLSGFFGDNRPTVLGVVKSVDRNERTCVLDDDGVEIPNVRLQPVVGSKYGLVKFPQTGAYLLATRVESSEEWMMLAASEYESIEITSESVIFNSGKFGGLIKIEELTKKLNELVQKFNSHTHLVNTTGTAAAQSGTAQPITGKASNFIKSDYENEKIKH